MYYLKNKNFWLFGSFFFFYFFIMGAYFPFFPIWLADVNQVTKAETGIIFASISLCSLIFQPVFGVMSDKLGLKKNLMWIITGMLVMFGPFFIYVFGPLLKINIYLASVVGGIYLGFIYNGGAPVIEAYIEKVSRRSSFEFGRARLFGCIGWAICASIAGIMMTINDQFVFWMGSAIASSAVEVVILKTLHMFEVPFLIVGCFKYITTVFEVRFSATIYLVCFCFFKQLSIMVMSVFTGQLYESVGFQGTYLILGCIALTFTIISFFTLTSPAKARYAKSPRS